MKTAPLRSCVVILSLVSSLGGGVVAAPRPQREIVATVDGTAITRDRFEEELKRWGGRKALKKLARRSTRRQLVEMTTRGLVRQIVVQNELKRRALTIPSSSIEARFAWFRLRYPGVRGFHRYLNLRKMSEARLLDEIRFEAGLERLLRADGKLKVDEAAVRRYYESHRFLFDWPLRVRVSQIVIKIALPPTDVNIARAKSHIEALRARYLKGERFENLALQYSQHRPSAGRGGDIGFLDEKMSRAAWQRDLFDTKVGGITKTHQRYRTDFVFYKVTAREERGVRRYQDVRSFARQAYLASVVATLRGAYLGELVRRARIVVQPGLEE
ncbi:MAG: peptidylprolyl isomerase [Myxococcales bacterium]|nr:peptidylprolyl isomerase [Myxococcales bacterium]